jgi:dethiobiotin synthetase
MNQGYFVTGTDTGVGKTLISCATLYHLGRKGLTTAAMKPVAAGCMASSDGLVNEDVEALRKAAGIRLGSKEICPYLFSAAIAPHIAATETNAPISLITIRDSFFKLTHRANVVVVEGVGGFRVPLDERYDTADLAVMLSLPVIIVVGLRLGCLNHALLTVDAVRARGLSIAGWVANQIDPDMARVEKNIEALVDRLPCRCIAKVPFLRPPDPSRVELSL